MDEANLEVITDVFGQFMEVDEENEDTMYLPTDNLKDAMGALGLKLDHARAIARTLDPGDSGRIGYEQFVEIMTFQLKDQQKAGHGGDDDDDEEIRQAYELFKKGGAQGPITIHDLKRISSTAVKDNASDEQLQEMLSLGKTSMSVDFDDFKTLFRQFT